MKTWLLVRKEVAPKDNTARVYVERQFVGYDFFSELRPAMLSKLRRQR